MLEVPFLEVPVAINNGPVKLLFSYFQDRGFNSFKDNLIKIRVSKNPLIHFFLVGYATEKSLHSLLRGRLVISYPDLLSTKSSSASSARIWVRDWLLEESLDKTVS